MIVTLALLALSQPADVSCQEIESVRRLAQQERLDTTSLNALLRRYCDRAPARERDRERPISAGCRDLRTMRLLAGLQGKDDSVVSSHSEQVCALDAAFPSRWPNGVRASASRGALYWPNGVRARSSSGDWYYPNGVRAGSMARSLYWPNGVRARTKAGVWYHKNGVRAPGEVEVLNRACADRDCRRALRRVRRASGEWRAFIVMSIALER